ncbi:sigma 54-interacting transcriptional regulator [Sorangium sp. So ce341]|uniref:sigma 54-interacting transcriptional regulator n=1 Tax=Sorangium sp. So ce341 TaxID=3133302 RepID=UPI003F5D7413
MPDERVGREGMSEATASWGPTRTDDAPRGAGEGGSYLLVVQGSSSSVLRLPRSGVVLLGRGPRADVRLRNTSASREHAKIVLLDGRAQLVDLGSRNGTLLNGVPVDGARPLGSGDVVSIGDTVVVMRCPRPARSRQILELAELRRRIEAEIDRALRHDRPAAVIAVQLGAAAAREAVAGALERELAVTDFAGFEADDRLLVLLPEADAAAAGHVVQRLLDAARAAGAAPSAHAAPRAGVATAPADGCDADTLVASARAAAEVALPGQAAAAAEAVTTLEIGGQRTVLADAATVRVFDLIRRLAATDLPVLVTGETGVGKESAARALHEWSPRAKRPLVTLNCAAMPESLVESELFGYERGAFSGAAGPKPGLLEHGSGGTVFLDEIGDLSASAQAKILRAIEAKRILRLGDVREREVDIRLVAATHKDLQGEVKAGRFRQDLYYRLGAATVILPPLRERPREILALSRAFLADACARAGREEMVLSTEATELFATYAWPGNVRELKNVIEYIAATVSARIVERGHLPAPLAPAPPRAESAPPSVAPAAPAAGAAAPASRGPGRSFRPLAEEVRELERTRIAEALAAVGGVQTKAAEALHMPLRTFVLKMNRYGLAKRRR